MNFKERTFWLAKYVEKFGRSDSREEAEPRSVQILPHLLHTKFLDPLPSKVPKAPEAS